MKLRLVMTTTSELDRTERLQMQAIGINRIKRSEFERREVHPEVERFVRETDAMAERRKSDPQLHAHVHVMNRQIERGGLAG